MLFLLVFPKIVGPFSHKGTVLSSFCSSKWCFVQILLCRLIIMLHYKNRFLINVHQLGEQLELINSSLEAEDLAAFCLDLAWRAAANEDFRACNLSNYVQDVEKQVSVVLKNNTYTIKNTPISVLSALSCQREKLFSKRTNEEILKSGNLIWYHIVIIECIIKNLFWFGGSWGLKYWERARGVLDIFSSFWQPQSFLFQLIQSRTAPAKASREGRSRFLKKDSSTRVRRKSDIVQKVYFLHACNPKI